MLWEGLEKIQAILTLARRVTRKMWWKILSRLLEDFYANGAMKKFWWKNWKSMKKKNLKKPELNGPSSKAKINTIINLLKNFLLSPNGHPFLSTFFKIKHLNGFKIVELLIKNHTLMSCKATLKLLLTMKNLIKLFAWGLETMKNEQNTQTKT